MTTKRQRRSLSELFEQGKSLHMLGKVFEAEKTYRKILSRYPNNAPTLVLLGMLAEQMGEYQDARTLLTKAIKINPQDPVYYTS